MSFCENDGINTPEVFQKLNPRHVLCGPAYTHPPARQEGAREDYEAKVERVAKAMAYEASKEHFSDAEELWAHLCDDERNDYRRMARAALDAAGVSRG